jgi:hypothetical protein
MYIAICKLAKRQKIARNPPMSPLLNPRHEIFAQAHARGASLDDAFEDACRLAKRADVTARVAALRGEGEKADQSAPQMIIDALVRMALDSEALKTPAAMKEARLNLLEADRLRRTLTKNRHFERYQIANEPAV